MNARRRAGGVMVAALTACGVAVPALAAGHDARRTAAQNHDAATQDAKQLLTRLNLPSDATLSQSEPQGDGQALSGSPATAAEVKQVDLKRWWTASESTSAVLNYVKAHPPAGGRLVLSGGEGHCQPGQRPPDHCHTRLTFIGFQFPQVRGVLGTRWLLVTVAHLKNGSTGIRADAQVQWIIPRPPGERVPSGATLVDVIRRTHGQPPTVSRTVTNRSEVRRIIKLVDRLPALQPGVWSCPAEPSNPAIVTLTFRARPGGTALAKASASAQSGNSETGCDAMSFSVRGHREKALVHTRHFLHAVGQVMGVKLTEPYGRQ